MTTKVSMTKEIQRAIWRASEKHGSQAVLADRCGINRQTLNKIANLDVQAVTRSTWQKLYPFLSEFLSDDYGISIRGNYNAVNGSSVVVDNSGIEQFRSGLIRRIVALDIDPAAKDLVLREILR